MLLPDQLIVGSYVRAGRLNCDRYVYRVSSVSGNLATLRRATGNTANLEFYEGAWVDTTLGILWSVEASEARDSERFEEIERYLRGE